MDRPSTGTVEQRTAAVEVADKRIRGLIPYGVESRDLGGWTEVIEPTAFRATKLDELRAVIDHGGVPLGRYPATLDVEDRDEGLAWTLDPPRSRQDVIEAVERGDMRAGSWRMVVAKDRWDGDTRYVEAIAELKDVTIVGAHDPAYGDAAPVEYRTHKGGSRRQGGAEDMGSGDNGASTATENGNAEERTNGSEENTEQRAEAERTSTGSLQVEQRSSSPRRRLSEEFRAAGFPGEVAEVPWQTYEDRAVTWSPSVNLLNQVDRQGGALPVDSRYAWTALQREPQDYATTSVQVLMHVSQTAASGVVRDIDATTDKAEVTSTIELVTVPLKGVAAVESGIPNIVLEQPAIDTIIENDLRTAVNEGLDSLIVATFAASDNQAPGTDPLPTSIRKAMTVLMADGYNPDVVILDPASAEGLDTLVTGLEGGDAHYVFGPGNFASGLFNLRKVVSKSIATPVVLDSNAYGKLYASPARLARFEENAGKSNTSLVRLELNAACGVERQGAAVRIAAS